MPAALTDAPKAPPDPPPRAPGSVARFRALLAAERAAARRADTAALLGLQDEKREALAALRAEPAAFEAARASLAEEAERNVALLRQLRQLYEGALSQSPATYGRVGRQQTPAPSRSWGTR